MKKITTLFMNTILIIAILASKKVMATNLDGFDQLILKPAYVEFYIENASIGDDFFALANNHNLNNIAQDMTLLTFEEKYSLVDDELSRTIDKVISGEKILFTKDGLKLMENYYPRLYTKLKGSCKSKNEVVFSKNELNSEEKEDLVIPYAYRHRTGTAVGEFKSPLGGTPIFRISSNVDWGVDDSSNIIDYVNPSSHVTNLDSQTDVRIIASYGDFTNGKRIYTHTIRADGTYGRGTLSEMIVSGSLYFKIDGLYMHYNIYSPY